MPVGIQRLNARRTQPNANIVFIKPLPGPDSAIAENFLERIAAQCLPIMKEHHLSVVTLEEYEPNREFVGRNFNAGEVIQLVLRSARPPHRWLPFRYVQMVMMHELAHCTQMNHARAFWAVRNAYAAAMTRLWARDYTGEGLWGRGAALATGAAWEHNTLAADEPLPEHLCGGTYRSRRRAGRKRKPKASWREQKERRIAKKFGTNGMPLGADEEEKLRLEGGKKKPGRPRVAGSARGRELRAAAALARFDKQVVEVKEDEEETASGSEYEEEEEGVDAVDVDGKLMKDKDGCALVKVCEDEDGNDPAARNELDELRRVFAQPPTPNGRDGGSAAEEEHVPRIKNEPNLSTGPRSLHVLPARATSSFAAEPPELSLHDIPHIRDAPPSKLAAVHRRDLTLGPDAAAPPAKARPAITIHRLPKTAAQSPRKEQAAPTTGPAGPAATTATCPVCLLDNDAAAARCAVCAHVLRPDAVRGAWACPGAGCRRTGYVNAGDCGVCGLCGGRKP